MKIKYLLITAVLATAIFGFGATNVYVAKATTGADCLSVVGGSNYSTNERATCLQDLITQLTTQTKVLQNQQGQNQEWCYRFTKNLGFTDSGNADVGVLHTVLDKQGFSYEPDTGNTYNEGTAFALIKLQKKYGIRPTGYFGSLTRAKVNILYKCKPVNESSITILSPNEGGTLQAGQSYTVTWKSTGLDKVDINLVYSSNVRSALASQVSAFLGTYTFTLPSTLEVGKYKLVVGFSGVEDMSDQYFDVTASPIQLQDIVTFPAAGSRLVKGSTYNITWSTNKRTTSIDISISAPNFVQDIATGISNTGSFTWIVPTSLSVGTNYKITIKTDDLTEYALSKEFTVSDTGPKVTLTYPTSGSFIAGQQVIVMWNTTNIPSGAMFALALQSNVGSHLTTDLAKGISGAQRSYSVTIPSNLSGTYKLWLTMYSEDGLIYDQSISNDISINSRLVLNDIRRQLSSLMDAIKLLLKSK